MQKESSWYRTPLWHMAHSVTDRQTYIIVAIAHAAKTLITPAIQYPFEGQDMIRENTISIVPHRPNSVPNAATMRLTEDGRKASARKPSFERPSCKQDKHLSRAFLLPPTMQWQAPEWKVFAQKLPFDRLVSSAAQCVAAAASAKKFNVPILLTACSFYCWIRTKLVVWVSWRSFGVISCLVHHRRQLRNRRCM